MADLEEMRRMLAVIVRKEVVRAEEEGNEDLTRWFKAWLEKETKEAEESPDGVQTKDDSTEKQQHEELKGIDNTAESVWTFGGGSGLEAEEWLENLGNARQAGDWLEDLTRSVLGSKLNRAAGGWHRNYGSEWESFDLWKIAFKGRFGRKPKSPPRKRCSECEEFGHSEGDCTWSPFWKRREQMDR